MEQIQLARRDVKDRIDKFKRERSNAGEEMKEDKMLEPSLKVVDRAGNQCIKHGMMCLLLSPHASDDTEKGKVVRHNLKDVWGRHRKCDEIRDYLGNYLVTIAPVHTLGGHLLNLFLEAPIRLLKHYRSRL